MNYNEATKLDIRTIQLMCERLTLQVSIPPFFNSQSDIRVLEDFMGRTCLQITQKVAKETLTERLEKKVKVSLPYKVEHKQPKSWWQMFKKQHFPIWLLMKYPVQYETITYTGNSISDVVVEVQNSADVFYPKISLPNESHYVHVRIPEVVSARIFD